VYQALAWDLAQFLCFMFYALLTVHLSLILVNDLLDAQFFFFVRLFQSSTCFEQRCAHHQENQLYQYNIWYMSLCVSGRLVCSSGRNFQVGKELPDLHTRRPLTQSDIYQMLYWCNWFSWWWAQRCSKHVEDWNKRTKKKELCVKLVIYQNETYQGVILFFQWPS
jgi:hypothetical protein